MSQSRKHSAFESVANIIAGCLIAYAGQCLIFPLLNIPVSTVQNLKIMAFFTVVSLVRSYALRRLFNKIAGICHE